MTDFSVPQRMGSGAFFINFLKFFRTILSAVIFVLILEIFNSGDGLVRNLLKIAVMTGITAVLALIFASVAYFQIKFHVEGGNLIYRHRVISRATTTIPLNRIHTLRTRQGLLYRFLGLRGILFDTLEAKSEEIELILSESDWQSLLTRIEQQEQPHLAECDMSPAGSLSSTKRFSNETLVLDALCQNHLKGMLVLGGLLAVIFDYLTDLSEGTVRMFVGYIESHPDHFLLSVAGIAVIIISIYLVSVLLWLGKVLLRYYNLSLTYDSKMLTFSHGLFSRLSSRFTRDKICTVWIKRNYLEKHFGLCTLALKQALNTSAQNEEDNLKIYGKDTSDFFLGWWLGHDYGLEADISSAKSGKGVVTYSLFPDLLISSVATALLLYFELYGWIIVPAIYLLAGIPKGIMMMHHSYITLLDSYLVIGAGRFAEIRNYLKYDNVEVVRITRTPLTPFTGRVSLSLSTTGSTFTIRSLKQDIAQHIYELLLSKSMATTCPATAE